MNIQDDIKITLRACTQICDVMSQRKSRQNLIFQVNEVILTIFLFVFQVRANWQTLGGNGCGLDLGASFYISHPARMALVHRGPLQ